MNIARLLELERESLTLSTFLAAIRATRPDLNAKVQAALEAAQVLREHDEGGK